MDISQNKFSNHKETSQNEQKKWISSIIDLGCHSSIAKGCLTSRAAVTRRVACSRSRQKHLKTLEEDSYLSQLHVRWLEYTITDPSLAASVLPLTAYLCACEEEYALINPPREPTSVVFFSITMNPANPRRKPPAFKPPQPIHGGSQSTSKQAVPAKRTASSTAASTAKRPAAVASKGKAPVRAAAIPIASQEDSEPGEEEEDESENENENEDEDEDEEDGDMESPKTRAEPVEDIKPAIPQKLLAKLIHDNFEDQDVKIGKEAMTVVGEYMKTFVREALARANHEMNENGDLLSDGFLQVSQPPATTCMFDDVQSLT